MALTREELLLRKALLEKKVALESQMTAQPTVAPVIKKQPTLFDKMGANLTNKATRPIGISGLLGVGMSAAGVPEESAYPVVGDVIGSMLGGSIGSAVGSAGGEFLKQGAENIRGTRKGIDPVKAGVSGAVSGATTYLGGKLGDVVFAKGKALNFLDKEGKQFSNMILDLAKKAKTDPKLTVPSTTVLNIVDQAIQDVPEALRAGNGMSFLKKFRKQLVDNPVISIKDLYPYEQRLGKLMAQNSFIDPVANPQMNSALSAIRGSISNINDGLAAVGGYPEFGALSKQVSNALGVVGEKGSGFTDNLMKRLGVGALVKSVTHSTPAGVVSSMLEPAIEQPIAQKAMAGLAFGLPGQVAGFAAKEKARNLLSILGEGQGSR